MKALIGGELVNVSDPDCPKRPCFQRYFCQGTFGPGGYKSYHRSFWACRTRDLQGCPDPKPDPEPKKRTRK